MMAAALFDKRLIDLLPKVRGRLTENVSLAKSTWFGVGGPAEILFKPADEEDLATFLRERPTEVPLTVLGVGSNLLVRDGGIPGIVIRLGRAFADIIIKDTIVEAGAGALDLNVALATADASIGGLEFLSGIPGTIGGALRMNAGAYHSDLSQIFEEAIALDEQGNRHRLNKAEMKFSYRHCGLPESWIFIQARLKGIKEDSKIVRERIQAIQEERQRSQPQPAKTGGSTFVNPPGHRAWKLIDQAGCRGLRIGGAMVSEKHCNFLVNTGGASAADIEALGEEVQRRVKEKSGIELSWEIRKIGISGNKTPQDKGGDA